MPPNKLPGDIEHMLVTPYQNNMTLFSDALILYLISLFSKMASYPSRILVSSCLASRLYALRGRPTLLMSTARMITHIQSTYF